jgi:hypothetical protein
VVYIGEDVYLIANGRNGVVFLIFLHRTQNIFLTRNFHPRARARVTTSITSEAIN